ncbi:RNA-binding, CRM domain-containing protein [Artemisia annua]|uniref:RNA-binding, CRM domain-containing protein n=1 Tax=Artemisia annua TaxID=35608 RepID=A0A2U1MSJ4_ARTAN|nr:RNA-binding, CRM domain-containing protein [Artemisia annua]
MFATKHLQKRCLQTLTQHFITKDVNLLRHVTTPIQSSFVIRDDEAKKKVALLLQKLKKYELPELPPPRHDPELLTPEQVQALKKIGFRNRNYVPVGVRGVFGGVVQNMHMHWKFHETVQVCCDNFPKEKIKEMATMLARLSGGIVVNIHNVKTIIMFRGRNYRQPKNLIPINTLTKRKALFKARFEQALDSQKLNIKKIEQQLRRMNVNPDDPVAMASIQRVASTFFNAIDKKEGSPYVFHGEKKSTSGTIDTKEPESDEDSDQEELDKFIAEIEDAADKEWEAEEAAEQEEVNKIRYLYKEDYDGRYDAPRVERWKGGKNGRSGNGGRFNERDDSRFMREPVQEESDAEDILNDLENVMFESDEEKESRPSSKATNYETEREHIMDQAEDLKYCAAVQGNKPVAIHHCHEGNKMSQICRMEHCAQHRGAYCCYPAKKKVALLLQKLKKYELPELPPPRHDPELLTPEQVQALKKIGFRNRNYVPVGVRGVFGGVVQNMHMHWKFHETVQVCCDNFPKEKIKEMATMLARLSGGIVVNIHNVKTIIMFRGRNYRQPKNLIPINTLTKRKALFKARFEQALDSQKLNIKKIEQQLRRMNVNPDDPVAMASIQRVASTFFNAIDKKEGSPYVFHGDKKSKSGTIDTNEPESGEDSDQEELDKFIAEIEDAADKEWEAEEAAEQEEVNKIRYLYKEDYDGRYTKPGMGRMAPQRIK